MANRQALDAWLLSEAAEDAESADEAFAEVFRDVLKIEAGPDFVARTVALAQLRRAERKRRFALGWAAALFAMASCIVAAYVTLPHVVSWAIKAVAVTLSRGVPWFVSFSSVALEWWWMVGRVGGSVAAAITTPAPAALLISVDLVGILAFLGLQKLTRSERLGDAHV